MAVYDFLIGYFLLFFLVFFPLRTEVIKYKKKTNQRDIRKISYFVIQSSSSTSEWPTTPIFVCAFI